MFKTPLQAILLSVALPFLAGHAQSVQAKVPNVVTDIPPIHGLVAAVMEGVGAPKLLIEKNASPHDFALRPSQARALSQADVLFWSTSDLVPWLSKVRGSLAPDAISVPLIDLPQSLRLPFRESVIFGAPDVDAEHEHHEEDDHAAHGHDDNEHAEHDDHAENNNHEIRDTHEGHDHSGTDPHAWLDPDNAIIWLTAISKVLVEADPENAEVYTENAANAIAEIEAVRAQVQLQLTPFQDLKFIVFHDAYQYFEAQFDLGAMGSISLGDSSAPSPARIKQLQNEITERGVECVMSEPQFSPDLIATVIERSNDAAQIKHSVLDPLGTEIELGPQFYTTLLIDIAASVADCR